MRKGVGTITSAVATAILAVGLLSTAAASAAPETTWTITPGGPVFVEGSRFFWAALVDPATGQTHWSVTCERSQATGEAESGSGLPGEKIARVDTIKFWSSGTGHDKACTSGEGDTNVNPGGVPWFLNADEDGWDEETQTVTGTLTSDHPLGVHFDFKVWVGVNSCEVQIRGRDGAKGRLGAEYDNVNGVLSAQGTSNLVVTRVSGACDSYSFRLGDELLIVSADYLVQPKQTITPED